MKLPSPVIIDTSALVSTASISDSNHSLSLRIIDKIEQERRPLIVPTDVFSETVNVMGKKIGHKEAYGTATYILENPGFILQDTPPEVRRGALEKFITAKPSISYTDCVVMAFADYSSTRDIFGFDEGFKKSGYIRIGIDSALHNEKTS